MKILCIGSAVIDLNAAGIPDPSLWQEKQRIEKLLLAPGGDAVNQSIALSKCGLPVCLVSAVGPDDNGRILRAALEQAGVDTRYFCVKEDASTGTSLVLISPDGERHIFSTGGAYWNMTSDDLPKLSEVSAISIASLCQMPGLEADGLSDYLKRAREAGIPVFADLASEKEHTGLDSIRHLLPDIDYFLPSLGDALQMTGTESAEAAARIYRQAGAKHVVIKCGGDGCYVFTEQEAGWVPALPVTPIDTTGAGDCMVAVFVSGILAGQSVRSACESACAVASESTLYLGAGGAPKEIFHS